MAAEHDHKAITDLLNRYLESYQMRNIEALSDLVANDADFLAFGTDEGEEWIGWDEYRTASEKLFGAMQEIHWTRGEPKIRFSRDGNVAWFSEDMTGHFVSGGEKHECPFRLTGIAEKREETWVMVQFHRAVPVAEHAVPYLETHGVRFD